MDMALSDTPSAPTRYLVGNIMSVALGVLIFGSMIYTVL